MVQVAKSVKQFLGFGKAGEGIEKTVSSYGLSFIKDEKLAWRLSKLDAGLEDIYATEDVNKKIHVVDKLVKTVAYFWGMGGDDPGFMLCVQGWGGLITHWRRYSKLYDLSPLESFFSLKQRKALLDDYGLKNVIEFGFYVIARSIHGRDVTPANLAMIQTSMQSGERGIQPFYKSKYGEGTGGGKTTET